MIHIDGFHLSARGGAASSAQPGTGQRLPLPPFRASLPAQPDSPRNDGGLHRAHPVLRGQEVESETALRSTRPFIQLRVRSQFAKLSGRQYKPVEHYRTEDADTLLLTMGSFSEIAMDAVDQLRDRGENVGLIRLAPVAAVPLPGTAPGHGECQTLVVLDRCVSPPDRPDQCARRSRPALYSQKKRPNVAGFIGGLGGRDLTPASSVSMVERGRVTAAPGRRRNR